MSGAGLMGRGGVSVQKGSLSGGEGTLCLERSLCPGGRPLWTE